MFYIILLYFIKVNNYDRNWGPFVEAQQTEEPNDEGHKELTR